MRLTARWARTGLRAALGRPKLGVNTVTKTYPAFRTRTREGHLSDHFQAGAADRLNFRFVFGVARAHAREIGGTVEIFRAKA